MDGAHTIQFTISITSLEAGMKPCDHVLLDSDTTVKVTHSRSAPEPGLGQPLYAKDLVNPPTMLGI